MKSRIVFILALKNMVLLVMLVCGVSLHASYAEFLKFVETKEPRQYEEAVLKMLYEHFLESLSASSAPLLTAIGGSPGAGKTTFRKTSLNSENAYLRSTDAVMVLLPGYQEDAATMGARAALEKWYFVAHKMSQILFQYAIESRYSIVSDSTCSSEKAYFDLLYAKECGYRIRLIGLYADIEIAKERALKREREQGQPMVKEVFNETRARYSALWPYLCSLADETTLYQTDTNTGVPLLLFSSDVGVQDLQVYQIFLDEGESFRDYFLSKIGTPDSNQ